MDMLPYQQRVVTEKKKLSKKLSKLMAFFQTSTFAGLSEAEQSRLRTQARLMNGYLAILEARICSFGD